MWVVHASRCLELLALKLAVERFAVLAGATDACRATEKIRKSMRQKYANHGPPVV
jgi:hypothetical protein